MQHVPVRDGHHPGLRHRRRHQLVRLPVPQGQLPALRCRRRPLPGCAPALTRVPQLSLAHPRLLTVSPAPLTVTWLTSVLTTRCRTLLTSEAAAASTGTSHTSIDTVLELDEALTDPTQCKNDQQRLVSCPPISACRAHTVGRCFGCRFDSEMLTDHASPHKARLPVADNPLQLAGQEWILLLIGTQRWPCRWSPCSRCCPRASHAPARPALPSLLARSPSTRPAARLWRTSPRAAATAPRPCPATPPPLLIRCAQCCPGTSRWLSHNLRQPLHPSLSTVSTVHRLCQSLQALVQSPP